MSTSNHDVRHSATLLLVSALLWACAAALLAMLLNASVADRKGWEFLMVGLFSLVGMLVGIVAIDDWPRQRRR